MEIHNEYEKLKEQIKSIEDLLYRGSDITLPLNVLSKSLEKVEEEFRRYKTMVDKHNVDISKINQESIRARNQMVYMFLTIIGTLLGKLLLQYLAG